MTEPMISAPLVRLDAALGEQKDEVIRALAGIVAEAGRTEDAAGLAADALDREATSATGLPGGIAIPHCRTEHVSVPTLAFARLSPPTDFGAKDGPADLAFLIAAPAGGDATHLQLLTKLARALVKSEFTDSLRAAETPDDVVALVAGVVDPDHVPAPTRTTAAPEPAPFLTEPDSAPQEDRRRILVAVTACPTGIAHTYMAAEALEAAGQRAGVEIHLETQGSAGSTPLDVGTIRTADAAIFATDVGVRDRARFAGKPVLASGVKRAIDDADAMIAEALRLADEPNPPRVEGSADASATSSPHGADEAWGLRVRRVLMTGVSYMIPFVAAGGLLIALSFLVGGYEIALGDNASKIMDSNTILNLPDAGALGLHHAWGNLGAYLAAVFLTLGGAAFSFLVPALSGYIAFAIADRPGIAPGFVMGFIANSATVKAGFLGGIIGGVLAGLVAHWIASRKVPSWLRGLMPVVVIPLLATLVSGSIMLLVLAKPLGALMSGLNSGLTHMSGGGAGIALGVLLGLMMAFDMGGPLNKTAYLFATTGLGAAAAATGNAPQLEIMAAVMLAGMVPPLALALATLARPRLFTDAERENGKAAWLLGASFITEGAIPFAAADPLRVIPSIMLGSAVTGGLSMAFHVTLRAPHGGIFVLFAVGHVIWFLLALLAGVLVAAACVVALKSLTESSEEIEELGELAELAESAA